MGADHNAENEKGATPLHKARNSKMVQLLLSKGADPYQKKTSKKREKDEDVFSHFLHKHTTLSASFMNHQISSRDDNFADKKFKIIYDLELFKTRASTESGEMGLHKEMVEANRMDLLCHPLSDFFLQLKYPLIRPFFFVNLLIVLWFTVCLSVLSCLPCPILPWNVHSSRRPDIPRCSELRNQTHLCFTAAWEEELNCQTFLSFYTMTVLALIPLILREVFMIVFKGFWKHFKDGENWLELVMFGCTVGFLVTLYFGPESHIQWEGIGIKIRWQPHLGASSVLLAWIELTLLMGRFPSIGVYVHMTVHVTKLIISLLLFYLTTLIGFSFAFHILLPDHEGYDNPITSALKVLGMMSGEFEISGTFLWDVSVEKGSNTSPQVVFLIFYITVGIAVYNLLIGFTVSKTDELYKKAREIKLAKTEQNIRETESAYLQIVSKLCPISSMKTWFLEKLLLFKDTEKSHKGK